MRIWIALAILAVIVLRRFSAIGGSALSMVVAAAVGMWGYSAYSDGAPLSIFNKVLPATAFYLLVCVWIAVEGYALGQAVRKRRDERARAAQQGD